MEKNGIAYGLACSLLAIALLIGLPLMQQNHGATYAIKSGITSVPLNISQFNSSVTCSQAGSEPDFSSIGILLPYPSNSTTCTINTETISQQRSQFESGFSFEGAFVTNAMAAKAMAPNASFSAYDEEAVFATNETNGVRNGYGFVASMQNRTIYGLIQTGSERILVALMPNDNMPHNFTVNTTFVNGTGTYRFYIDGLMINSESVESAGSANQSYHLAATTYRGEDGWNSYNSYLMIGSISYIPVNMSKVIWPKESLEQYASNQTANSVASSNATTHTHNSSAALASHSNPASNSTASKQASNATQSQSIGFGGGGGGGGWVGGGYAVSYPAPPNPPSSQANTSNTSNTVNTTNTVTAISNANHVNTSTPENNAVTYPTPSITLTPSTTWVDEGQSISFMNTTSSGTPPYTYSYIVTPLTGVTITGNRAGFAAPGAYNVFERVTDAHGETASSPTFAITVYATPTIALSPSATTVTAGQTVNFTNTTANGSTPYVYYYTANPSAGVTVAGNKVTFSSPGVYDITEQLVDYKQVDASSSSVVTVQAGSDTNSGSHNQTTTSPPPTSPPPVTTAPSTTFHITNTCPQSPLPSYNNSAIYLPYANVTPGSCANVLNDVDEIGSQEQSGFSFTGRFVVNGQSAYGFDEEVVTSVDDVVNWTGQEYGIRANFQNHTVYGYVQDGTKKVNGYTYFYSVPLMTVDGNFHSYKAVVTSSPLGDGTFKNTFNYYVDGALKGTIVWDSPNNYSSQSYHLIMTTHRWENGWASAGSGMTVENLTIDSNCGQISTLIGSILSLSSC